MSSFCSLSESNLLEAAIVLEEFCKASCINFILSLCLDVVVFKQQNQEQPQQKQIQVFSFIAQKVALFLPRTLENTT